MTKRWKVLSAALLLAAAAACGAEGRPESGALDTGFDPERLPVQDEMRYGSPLDLPSSHGTLIDEPDGHLSH